MISAETHSKSANEEFKQVNQVLLWAMAILTLIGLLVTIYMSYTSLIGGHLICGGLGNCDAVQASAYSRILDIPVSMLGLAAYAIIAVLLVATLNLKLSGERQYLALLGIFTSTMAGMVFSVYLTYVEIFVIRAICPWCLTSAVVLAILACLATAIVWDQSQPPAVP